MKEMSIHVIGRLMTSVSKSIKDNILWSSKVDFLRSYISKLCKTFSLSYTSYLILHVHWGLKRALERNSWNIYGSRYIHCTKLLFDRSKHALANSPLIWKHCQFFMPFMFKSGIIGNLLLSTWLPFSFTLLGLGIRENIWKSEADDWEDGNMHDTLNESFIH